jgi:hypothetical protein
MADKIFELFGYAPDDMSPDAVRARSKHECPFLQSRCIKKLHTKEKSGVQEASGVCTLLQKKAGPVIICPIRLYAGDYQILRDVADQAFPKNLELVVGSEIETFRRESPNKSCVVVFGQRWGKELRLPNRDKKKAGAYFVDWILAHISADGTLLGFVAVEVQSIDTTGNYQAERRSHLDGLPFLGRTTANFNWENVNKRILPQIIYKGHVLRQEPLCQKGLFFICPTPVYDKISERLGGRLSSIYQQPGSVTMMWYDVGPAVPAGQTRKLQLFGQFTTTVDKVALAFTAPDNLPPAGVYEQAIRAEL